ncbi:MFS transporter [Proteiniclasticum sp. SCR006]|uniref:MFS transporter n=1 Tax=Proteiniclasticum aestuarii TaxID=2817862 RepID=A0A939KK03_9CLOT|nr:MFS transporter [Proteiniclasticum aestuarii]MBO1264225.1 MFS transporter [Proteiniclasticum aestuarii]
MRKKLEHMLFGNSQNIKYYAINGILFTMVTVLSKSYAIKFLDRLGGEDIHFSLFNALPGFVAIFTTIPGILLIQKGKSKRKTLGTFFYISRLMPLFLAAVPFLPKTMQPMVFVLIYGLMNFPESISATSLQDYTGDIFSPHERADALSIRNQMSQISQISVSILVGFILSLSSVNRTVIIMYQIFIVLSFLIGLKEIHYMYKMEPLVTEEEQKEKSVPKLRESLRAVFSHKEYVSFLACSLLFHFGWQMGWPLFNVYQIKVLGADEMWLTIINVLSSIFMVLSFTQWKKVIKKFDYKLAIALATFGMGLTPLLYILSKNLVTLTFMQPVTGFFTAGTIVVVLGSLLAASPDEYRTMSVAVHATLTSVTLAVAPLFGTYIQDVLSIEGALFVSSSLRLLGSFVFLLRFLKARKQTS